MRLGHLRLPGLTSYHHAGQLQEALIQRHFLAKDLWRTSKAPGENKSSTISSPGPMVITAEFQPVYTFGRRQLNSVGEEHRRYLEDNGKATVVEAQRGGQVTYHGPGQLVAYPIINLRRHRITPREYMNFLQETVMEVCSKFDVPNVALTEDPGVWITGGERKICAVGVRMRRGITGHGIGLNIHDRNQSLTWGFSRIVACGLEGKQTTWLSKERSDGNTTIDVQSVATEFVSSFAARLGGIDEIYPLREKYLQSLVSEPDAILEEIA
jgi:lipoyl(octanoyl) transferase 2